MSVYNDNITLFSEGGCKYHSGGLTSEDWADVYSCCNEGSDSIESARDLPGCTSGKHRSKHHTEYFYAAYYFYMNDLVRIIFGLSLRICMVKRLRKYELMK